MTFNTILQNTIVLSFLIALWLLVRRRLMPRITPLYRYVAGIILIIGLLIPIRPSFPFLQWSLPAADTKQSEPVSAASNQSPSSLSFMDDNEQVADTVTPLRMDTTAPEGVTRDVSSEASQNPVPTLLLIWLSGIVIYVAFLVYRHLRFIRMMRRWRLKPLPAEDAILKQEAEKLGLRRIPALWRVGFIHSPMLIGLIHPTILLPDMPSPDEETRLILRHELIHLRRADLWFKALTLTAVALHWYNPLVHRLAYAVSTDCEMACDDAVLLHADFMGRKQYGQMILNIAARKNALYTAVSTNFIEGGIDMKRRLASMLDARPKRKGRIMLAAVLVMTLLGGGVFATETETLMDVLSPTTGLPTDTPYQPVMVNISNSEGARPAWGLASADIVYEATFWAPSHTRYLAIFNDEYPETVGSLRGARVYQAEWRQEWDCPFVFWGGQDSEGTSIYDFFKFYAPQEEFLIDGTRGSNLALSRSMERSSPHNAIINLGELVENYWPADENTGEPYEPHLPLLTFSNTPSIGDRTANQIYYNYIEGVPGFYDEEADSDYQPSYTFNAKDRVYERWYNGEPHTDYLTGERVVASNVITQYCELSYYNGAESRPILKTTGSGIIDAFIDGQHIQGTWLREDLDSQTRYLDANGDPLVLLPGKTFIQVLSPRMSVKVVDDAGQVYICAGI